MIAGCIGLDNANHLVQIKNYRERSYEITVFCKIKDNEGEEFGPRTVEPDENWEVTRFKQQGTLTIRFWVNNELVWENTHKIPNSSEELKSFAQVELLPNGEVRTEIMKEE